MYPQARGDRLLIKKMDDELVIYDQERHRAHRLNATAARIWRHCDGKTSVADLARQVGDELNLRPSEDLVRLALDRLEAACLLRVLPEQPVGARVSRRDVAKRLGLVGALAVLLPMVTSLTAPTPAMAGGGISPIAKLV